jgi:hypothetical protein
MTRAKEKNMRTVESSAKNFTISDQDLYERVARRAYELYQQRGEVPGHDLDDWLQAERVVHDELLHGPLPDALTMADDGYPDVDDQA